MPLIIRLTAYLSRFMLKRMDLHRATRLFLLIMIVTHIGFGFLKQIKKARAYFSVSYVRPEEPRGTIALERHYIAQYNAAPVVLGGEAS